VTEACDQAAIRHFDDAASLAENARWDGAGHLIGFAAECALKHAIVNLRPEQDAPHKHLPELREIAKRHLTLRSHMSLHTVLSQPDYFAGWVVEARYAATDTVLAETYDVWRTHASRTIGAAGLRR
jgi:hypothetical protein